MSEPRPRTGRNLNSLDLFRISNDASLGYHDGFELISRQTWGAAPTRWANRLFTPVSTVIISSTRKYWCHDLQTCQAQVIDLQHSQMHERTFKEDDILYNFLVGGDGRVYEGRGWFSRPSLPRKYKSLNNQSIYIAFIGRMKGMGPFEKMFFSTHQLIQLGINKGYIKPKYTEYILQPYHPTSNYLSPPTYHKHLTTQ